MNTRLIPIVSKPIKFIVWLMKIWSKLFSAKKNSVQKKFGEKNCQKDSWPNKFCSCSKKGITRLITMWTKHIVMIVGSKLCGNVFSCPKRFFVRK